MVDRLTGFPEASIAARIKSTDRAFFQPSWPSASHQPKPSRWAGHDRLLGPDAGKHRRGVRRYRNLAALRVSRGRRRRRAGPAGHAGHRARRSVADPLGAAYRRHRQIRPAAAARRQQRRGRHAVADGAGPAGAGPQKLAVAGAGRDRRLDVHRRFHDHAGDFGAVGGRRPQARGAGARALCGAADGLHPGRAVLGSEQRHGARRVGLWAGHGRLVRQRWR